MSLIVCTVQDCDRPAKGRYCVGHWGRFYKHGDVRADVPLRGWKPNPTACVADGCDRQPVAGGRCDGHYRRQRHGSTLTGALAVRGRSWLDGDGYVRLSRPGHPLAGSGGVLTEHRRVLYDAVGVGPHPCNWCGQSLSWDAAESAPLTVDHLDGDRLHNDVANLVPACASCNSRRARAGNPLDWSTQQ